MNLRPLASALEDSSFIYPRLDRYGEVIEEHTHTVSLFQDNLGAGVALEMASLPGGMFSMGSIRGTGYDDELPQHLVRVLPFYLGRGMVTQAQWKQVMGRVPPCRCPGVDLPVDRVSWHDAGDFCRKLSRLTGRPYRLPSEAEWEYACRAGTITPFSTGATITTDYANYCGDHVYRDEKPGLYRHVSTPAGMFPPNPFGLFDLHANLWEWCADPWHADYGGAPFSGEVWELGGERNWRVARGGSWHEPPVNCRSAARLRAHEAERDDLISFRVALSG